MSRFDWRANGVPAAGFMLRVTSSAPKRRLKTTWLSSSSGWPRKSEHGVLLEGGADLRPRSVVHGPGDVHAVDPGGEGRGEPGHAERHRALLQARRECAEGPGPVKRPPGDNRRAGGPTCTTLTAATNRRRLNGGDMLNAKRFLLVALLAGVVAAAQPALAQTTLTMSSWVSPQHHLTANVLQGWATEVEKATNGRVKFTMLPKHPSAPARHLRRRARRPRRPLVRHGQLHAGPPHPAAHARAARQRRDRARSTRSPTRASTGSTSTRSASTRA